MACLPLAVCILLTLSRFIVSVSPTCCCYSVDESNCPKDDVHEITVHCQRCNIGSQSSAINNTVYCSTNISYGEINLKCKCSHNQIFNCMNESGHHLTCISSPACSAQSLINTVVSPSPAVDSSLASSTMKLISVNTHNNYSLVTISSLMTMLSKSPSSSANGNLIIALAGSIGGITLLLLVTVIIALPAAIISRLKNRAVSVREAEAIPATERETCFKRPLPNSLPYYEDTHHSSYYDDMEHTYEELDNLESNSSRHHQSTASECGYSVAHNHIPNNNSSTPSRAFQNAVSLETENRNRLGFGEPEYALLEEGHDYAVLESNGKADSDPEVISGKSPPPKPVTGMKVDVQVLEKTDETYTHGKQWKDLHPRELVFPSSHHK